MSGAAQQEDPAPAIELRGISKAFGTVQANRGIDLTVPRGTIHGIIGENGAGKSTLMSILYGFYRPDAGQILIGGQPVTIPDSQSAIRAGIGMVFQHFKLVRNFTVLENVILGAEDGARLRPSLARARRELQRLAAEYELLVDPDTLIEDLSVGHQQRVEILKALYRQADILILDEPTGVLTPAEADHLFRILRGLRDEGKTIILITHKLREIMEITDNVSVMRRSRMVASRATAETSTAELAELMVGRKVLLRVDKAPARPGAPVLGVRGLRMTDATGVERLRGIDLEIRAGEILGIAGVAGNGQTQLLEILGGYPEPGARLSGELVLNGQALPLTGSDGRARRRAGIGHVPEDRQAEGLIMDFTAWENAAFGYHDAPEFRRGWFLDNAAMRADAAAKIEHFDVRPPDPELPAKSFSGGNQQKIVVAREVERNPDLLLIGQPTRGVDIGAIEFIHKRIVALRDAGKAVLLVSVELDEIMALSDRIAVMFDGRIMGERRPDQTTSGDLGSLMAGVDPASTDPQGAMPPAAAHPGHAPGAGA
ncbi:nucleoside ABC transporter ATP-binding protein [Paracoccus halophilus]|uniref:Heme ABC transporter ATP-binding protein n=1 Tax=Paracoccus halophilus TaxID=376733 RepID=A0A099F860_9RHOB|nr:ABC transporter ATP-binding protein [Paracoccus halophilus]KGJ06694.1 heme ABC transporter ATP-binding protein [Paracoccus halophilus]SFA42137.1 nucleoside ABC transporter ATP-binding protein [Paracoccus halophilus]